MNADVTGLILDGGRASRLGGVDKAFLDVGGETVAARTLRILRGLTAEVIVSTGRPEPWRALGLTCVPDGIEGAGPLAGLAAGLAAARTPLVLVVAGDMPFLSAAALERLVEAARAHPSGCAMPVHALPDGSEREEPLHAVYPASAGEVARELLARDTRRPAHLAAALGALRVPAASLPDAATTFRSLNTPEDLATARGEPRRTAS